MKKGVIAIPVADLRKEPKELIPYDFSHHSLRDSQLLYGERIGILETWNEWLHVEALEQACYSSEKGWHPYPGWVLRSEVVFIEEPPSPNRVVCVPWTSLYPTSFYVSFGTWLHEQKNGKIWLPDGEEGYCDPHALRSLTDSFSRELLLEDAHRFIGYPYLWGGRASFGKNVVSSVDCSGLVNLVHRAQGIVIPRDAHDQFLKAKKITPAELQPGDSIYLAREGKPERMTHVILYKGASTFIEAPETGKKVRSLPFLSPLAETVQLSDRPHRYHAYYGSYFSC